ncbi:MAG: glutamate synthase large subunit [Kiritimatiellae bacterium]|nr:glutamate synthase large subunit [Kiritimatiellia bacterium]
MNNDEQQDGQQGLYRSEYEHDACGVGLVANISGESNHDVVTDGLTILKRLMHRGATGNDPETGDGAGILLRIPDGFFRKKFSDLPPVGSYGVAVVFGAVGEEDVIEQKTAASRCRISAWRDVPVDPSAIGPLARSSMPRIRQVFIECDDGHDLKAPADFERRLFIIRREIEKSLKDGYICSMSSKTVVYKGLLLATQMEKFYPDLTDPGFVSPFAIVHQRYSTNTFPTWSLAHPFRMLAHNGEINTLKGNLNALAAREPSLASPLFGEDIKKVLPLIPPGQSDSASLDNMFELLVAAGRDAPHALMMLVPQAWGAGYHMGKDVRAFCEYHSALMEPWDGPSAIVFTDGVNAGAALDRNGLRPARWTLTRSDRFVLASETGVLDIPPAEVARHGRLKPGAMIWLDLEHHRIIEDAELKNFYARRRPYRRWVEDNRISVHGLFTEITPSRVSGSLAAEQARFGYTLEDLNLILKPMAETGHEPVGSMGDDATLACLSKKPRSLFDYFHQLFAQVTNPPIDPIREELVMSIMTYIGNVGNILDEGPQYAHLIKLRRPVLTDDELDRLSKVADRGYPAVTFPTFFHAGGGAGALEAALDDLAAGVLDAVGDGARIIVLSDKANDKRQKAMDGTPRPGAAIPSLLAVAAVNNALVKAGVRPSIGLIVQSGEVREVMHYALLLGFGATAVNPYLALETVSSLCPDDAVKAASNYVNAVDLGLKKIMSKMGISTLRSYRSARIFEAVGLDRSLVDRYFSGVASPVGGVGLAEIAKSAGALPPLASTRQNPSLLDAGGIYRYRKDGEAHLWTPDRLANFRNAVRRNDYELFRRYTDSVDNAGVTLRSKFTFRPTEPVPLDEVEPVDSIVRRFIGAAMSLGSLSPEAHETIAIALNALGTMSNCGEGGENPERFGTAANCGVKQVASGRFGVTVEYLRAAKDIQIKLAQGAKPGEGGQLPGHKVNEFVAALRHAKPGTTLISPPPHHDIYSIEDLAELIFDLKCANPKARISVKLVSEAGVGTIAAGVAKAHADVILVSGFDGGTGAAPLSSVKHAGLPWELGLAEVQQTLVKNGFRGRVRLQVDGQLRTGRDIVIAALMGAEEFGFGTSMLVSLGCVQCRNCSLNTCPVGIATQDTALRAHFAGRVEHLQTYFRFLAGEVRELLAKLGLRSLDEAVGRVDLLAAADASYSPLLHRESGDRPRSDPSAVKPELDNYDRRTLLPAILPLLSRADGPRRFSFAVNNTDRAVGAELSGEIVARRLHLDDDELTVDFTGVGGQSFAAFLAKGVSFNLHGSVNDYLAKGLSGGIVAVAPPEDGRFAPEENVIAGNVVAYGATSGSVFINGVAGERFAVRNSGATLVVEGVGDHGCEYMTGGHVVVLGPVGVNFAAGMTGGVAYVMDETGDLDLKCNLGSVDISPVTAGSSDESALTGFLSEHLRRTGSPLARRLLEDWPVALHKFVALKPHVD